MIKKNSKGFIVLFLIIILVCCGVGIDMLFSFNSRLSVYFLCYFCKEISTYVTSGIIILLVLIFIYKELNKTISYKKLIKKSLLISIIPFCIVEFIESPKNVKINNEYPNRLDYQIKIVKDLIENKTTTITINTNNIESYPTILYDSSTTHRKKNNSSHSEIDKCYVVYKQGNTAEYVCSQAENKYVVFIIKKLKQLENEITIEYYNNTGIIKAIDGINKNEFQKLNERVKFLKKQNNLQSVNVY